MIKASKEVCDRKAAMQTGFKKLNYPQFNREVLERWQLEVVPKRRPPALELAALRDSIPALAKVKIVTAVNMTEAWKLLDLNYGNLQEVRAKL